MSDIPGVTNNNVNTEKIIKAIMDAERVPLTRMEKELDTYKKLKKIWQDLNLSLTKLKNSANDLYSFNSPFNSKKAISSNENVLTATATRKAVLDTKELIVRQIATADRFMSGSLPKDYMIKAGTYIFQIGEKEISVTFKGGKLTDFVDAINKKGGKYLKASFVNDTKNTQVLIIESLITGSKNKLILKGDSVSLAEEINMIKRVPQTSLEINLNKNTIQKLDAKSEFNIQNNELIIQPKTNLQIPIKPSFSLNKNMVLEYEIKAEEITDKITEPETAPGPLLPETGSIEYKGIRIYNEQSILILPETEKIEPPKRVDNFNVLSFQSGSKNYELPAIKDSAAYYKVSVPIGEMASSLDAIIIQNTNTHRLLSIRNIKIFDPNVRGDYIPTNPISHANDAIIEYNGIKIIRESNEISDLIPEVTINLHDKSDEKIKLSIKYDTEAMKEAIVAFVGHYNRLITEIDILTRKDSSIIENASYLSEEEKVKAEERLGILNGDLTLMQLKSSLQTILMSAYKTSGGEAMALLAQIGIATNVRTGSGLNRTLLRGYLQIDEDKLDASLKSKPELIRELFGIDTDGDLVIDNGVAYKVDSHLKPFITSGGIINTRLSTLDTQMARKEKDILNLKRYLENFERDLKTKYGNMQALLDQLEKSRKQLENFNNRSSR